MKKLAVFFPGIGYTNDKPLLYYSLKLAKQTGFDIKRVDYSGFPDGVLNDPAKMAECFAIASEQTESILQEMDFAAFDEIVFVSKSIGTVIAANYAGKYHLPVRQILFTPVPQTFQFVKNDAGIAFHGTSDPWAETGIIQKECNEKRIPLKLFRDANHSLETGDVPEDLSILQAVLKEVRTYLESDI